MPNPICIITFDRSVVESLEFTGFLNSFDPAQMQPKQLRALMGTMMFGVKGYENDNRDEYEIPEIRRFYTELSNRWPYWMFFAKTERDLSIKTVYFCRTKILSHTKQGNELSTFFDLEHLVKLLSDDYLWCRHLAGLARIPDPTIFEQVQRLLNLFGLSDPSLSR